MFILSAIQFGICVALVDSSSNTEEEKIAEVIGIIAAFSVLAVGQALFSDLLSICSDTRQIFSAMVHCLLKSFHCVK